jgi:hypothetical protein
MVRRRGDQMDRTDLVIIGRVAGALAIGALIGFEPTFHGRPAGFRTHSLLVIHALFEPDPTGSLRAHPGSLDS